MIGIFFLLLVCFVVFSLAYVLSSGKFELARLFDLPVYITVLMLISFGLAPVQTLLAINENLREDALTLITALLLVILGMAAFWAGCKLMEPKRRQRPVVLPQQHGRGRAVAVALLLYVIGFACKVYLLGAHLFAYTASQDLYWDNLADAQVLQFGAQFGLFSLLILCIEKFSDPSKLMTRWLFWVVFLSECTWGVISGMKIIFLTNFLAVTLISTIVSGKLAKKWLFAVVAGIVISYPFVNAYRDVLNGVSTAEVTDFGTAVHALSLAAASGEQVSGNSSEWLQSGSDSTISRFDSLSIFATLITMGNLAQETHGDERVWMVPFYPFVPRVIWPTKPILDQAARLSDLLGKGRGTATNVPYIADCYIYAGVPGILGGMFVLGFFAQKFTNILNGPVSKYHVFRYSVLLLTCFWMESGVFTFWTLIMKTVVALFVIGWAAYGSAKPRTSPVVPRRMPVPQRA